MGADYYLHLAMDSVRFDRQGAKKVSGMVVLGNLGILE
jgi:hypothetical protein